LEQLRLTIAKQDFVRAAIVAGKINRKHLQEMPQYKIQFYTLLSTIHRYEKNELELIKDYHAIYLTHVQTMKTDEKAEDMVATTEEEVGEGDAMNQDDDDDVVSTPATSWTDAMKAVIVFLLLVPYSNEQQDILHHISIDTNLEKIPSYQYVFAFCAFTFHYHNEQNFSSLFFFCVFTATPKMRNVHTTKSHCTNVIEKGNHSLPNTKLGRN
jgi:hypothetical protein